MFHVKHYVTHPSLPGSPSRPLRRARGRSRGRRRGGSGRGAGGPASRRAGRRSARRPRTHSGSRRAHSGRRGRTWARRAAATFGSRRGRWPSPGHPVQQRQPSRALFHCLPDLLVAARLDPRLRHHDEVEAGAKWECVHDHPQLSLHPVARHRPPHPPADREPDAALRQPGRPRREVDQGMPGSSPAAHHLREVSRPPQPARFRTPSRRPKRGRGRVLHGFAPLLGPFRGPSRGSRRVRIVVVGGCLDRQSRATTLPAARDHLPPPGRGHPGAEPQLALARLALRLPGSLHRCIQSLPLTPRSARRVSP
jgi:hypothetical protein